MLNSRDNWELPGLRILVLGDSGVGKSSLLQRICHNEYPSNISNTAEANVEIMMHIHESVESYTFSSYGGTQSSINRRSQSYFIEFIDIGSSPQYKLARNVYYSNKQEIDGILFVFDIFDTKSYQNLKKWLKEYLQFSDHKNRMNNIYNNNDPNNFQMNDKHSQLIHNRRQLPYNNNNNNNESIINMDSLMTNNNNENNNNNNNNSNDEKHQINIFVIGNKWDESSNYEFNTLHKITELELAKRFDIRKLFKGKEFDSLVGSDNKNLITNSNRVFMSAFKDITNNNAQRRAIKQLKLFFDDIIQCKYNRIENRQKFNMYANYGNYGLANINIINDEKDDTLDKRDKRNNNDKLLIDVENGMNDVQRLDIDHISAAFDSSAKNFKSKSRSMTNRLWSFWKKEKA